MEYEHYKKLGRVEGFSLYNPSIFFTQHADASRDWAARIIAERSSHHLLDTG